MKTNIPNLDTTTLPVFHWETWPGELSGPQGPGKVYKARMDSPDGRIGWIHESPRGWQRPLGWNYQSMNPPPLTRKPHVAPVGKCGCGEYHHCSQCGEQTWVEIHGVADGYCTYCHHGG